MPPYVAHVPAATTAQAFGANWSIQSHVVIGCPVFASVPKVAQYPSSLFFSFGIDPSTTKMKGASLPSAASRKKRTNSSPFSNARKGLCNRTLGIQGKEPRTISSILGWVAAVTAMVSPSQPSPAVSQRMSISAMGAESHRRPSFAGAPEVIFLLGSARNCANDLVLGWIAKPILRERLRG